MMSVKKFKVVGTIAHVIGLAISVLVFVFGIYVAISNDRVIAIIVLDTFGGITGFIFAVIGIFSILTLNHSFLMLTRNACAVTAFFSIIYGVAHSMFPYYRDFYEDSFGLRDAYYLTGGGFIILVIESIYSIYIAHSLYTQTTPNKRIGDVEAPTGRKSFESFGRSRSQSNVQVI